MTDFELARISYVALGNIPSEWTAIPEQTFSKIASVIGPTKIDRLGDKIVSIRGDFPKHVEQRLVCEVPTAYIFSELPSALDEHEGAAAGTGAGGWVADVHSLSEDDNLIDGQMILVCVEAKDKSKEMYDFVEDFMFRTHQTDEAEEFILSGRCRSSNTIYAFYGAKVSTGVVDRRQANLKILYRLKDRKRLALASGKHEGIKAKIGQNHNTVRASVLKDRDAFFTRVSRCQIHKSQGIDLIRLQMKTSTFDVTMYEQQQVERSISTRKTTEEIDAEVRLKIDEFVERINHFVPIDEQVRTNFKLDEDTITEFVTKRVFMMSDRTFLRSNRRIIQQHIDLNIHQFKESEPAEAKVKRVKTARDGRRAIAESFAQKIRGYCDERLDEHGFCTLKNAYTHKALTRLLDDELITDDEYDESRTVKDEIDELLAVVRSRNEESNKGDLNKAKQLGRRLLEIFLFEFERFDSIELNDFYYNPREYVRQNVYENVDVSFGAAQFVLFNGVHHDLIVSTIRKEYENVQRARHAFIDAEQLRRAMEVEDPEREPFEESQRVKRAENDEITDFIKCFTAFRSNVSRMFGGSVAYAQKLAQYKRGLKGFSKEQIVVFEEDELIAPVQKRLYERYRVRSVDDLRTKYHTIREYVRDLSQFTPYESEVREYVRMNFANICNTGHVL